MCKKISTFKSRKCDVEHASFMGILVGSLLFMGGMLYLRYNVEVSTGTMDFDSHAESNSGYWNLKCRRNLSFKAVRYRMNKNHDPGVLHFCKMCSNFPSAFAKVKVWCGTLCTVSGHRLVGSLLFVGGMFYCVCAVEVRRHTYAVTTCPLSWMLVHA